MGGDHKCPVCQATFTRPQHVARHMRSHTGDRPYKCVHCGDQFARSDLLSRHINKCHASEKPAVTVNARRKGTSAASRATTSKQACDQCVQDSLPCDGSNPCSKCTQRKSRCTFVKFHRQTAPAGPGHIKPDPVVTPAPSSSSSSSQRASEQSPTVSMPGMDNILGFDGGSMGIPSLGDMRPMSSHGLTNGHDLPRMDMRPMSSRSGGMRSMNSPHETRSMSAHEYSQRHSMSGISIAQNNRLLYDEFQINGQREHASRGTVFEAGYDFSSPQTDSPFRFGNQMEEPGSYISQSAPSPHPFAVNHSMAQPQADYPLGETRGDFEGRYQGQAEMVRGSQTVDGFARSSPMNPSFNPDGTTQWSNYSSPNMVYLAHRRGSDAFSDVSYSDSRPSSATSSNAHLPDESPPEHHLSYHHDPNSGFPMGQFSETNTGSPQFSETQNGEERTNGGFSSAFGLMSLENPNVLAGLTHEAPFFSAAAMSMAPEDPNSTPMANKPVPGRYQRQRQTTGPVVSRDHETKELREFWKAYMRTPTSGPNSAGIDGQNPFGLRSPRRARVNSMPSGKTPTLDGAEVPPYPAHPMPVHHNGPPRQTIHGNPDDLRSYEAAVLARQAPTTLTIQPKRVRKSPQVPNLVPQGMGSGDGGGSGSSMPPPLVPVMFNRDVQYDFADANGGGDPHSRPSSSGSVRSPEVFSSGSSESPDMPGTNGMGNAQHHVAFANQVQYLQGGRQQLHHQNGSQASFYSDPVPSRQGSFSSVGSLDDGGAREMRPSFKRLPSQTLGPAFAKRVMLDADDEGDGSFHGGEGGYNGLQHHNHPHPHLQHQQHYDEQAMGMGHHPDRMVVNITNRRRRLSMPTSPSRPEFSELAQLQQQQQQQILLE